MISNAEGGCPRIPAFMIAAIASTFHSSLGHRPRRHLRRRAVTSLEVWRNGNVAFTINSTTACNQQLIINFSAAGAKNQYAVLLASRTTGRPVRVITTGCGPADNYGSSYSFPES